MLTVECAEYSKHRMVYAARKINKHFRIVMGSALFTYGALLAKFKLIDLNTKKAASLDKLLALANLLSIKPVEALYYTSIRNIVHTVENVKYITKLQMVQEKKYQ